MVKNSIEKIFMPDFSSIIIILKIAIFLYKIITYKKTNIQKLTTPAINLKYSFCSEYLL